MIEQKARVTQIFDNAVEVECEVSSTCSGCSNESQCGVGTVAKAFTGKTQLINIPTSRVLSPGQWVTIATAENNLLAHAFVTYFFPLLGLLFAGLFGQWLLVEKLLLPDYLAIACGVLGGYLSFLFGGKVLSRFDGNAPSIEIVGADYR